MIKNEEVQKGYLSDDLPLQALHEACEIAINVITGNLEPPVYVEDFIADATIIQLSGEDYAIHATQAVAQTVLTPDWLIEQMVKEKNIGLLVAVSRLSGGMVNMKKLEEEQKEKDFQYQEKVDNLETKLQTTNETYERRNNEERRKNDELNQKNQIMQNELKNVLSRQEKIEKDCLNWKEIANDLKYENEILRSNMDIMLVEHGNRDDADVTLRALHHETDLLLHRLTTQKKKIMQPVNVLREDNTRLAKSFQKERRNSVIAIGKNVDLELQLSERDHMIHRLKDELRNITNERDRLIKFTIDALGRDQLVGALSSPEVKRSWAVSRGK
jgi:hypothetical protein